MFKHASNVQKHMVFDVLTQKSKLFDNTVVYFAVSGGPQNMPKSAPGHPEAQNCIWWPSRHLEIVRNLMAEILEKFGGQAGGPKSSKT